MAQRLHSINTPALLRALADVLEQYPHDCTQLLCSCPTDIVEWIPVGKAVYTAVADVSFSTRVTIGQAGLNIAMAAAYKRHGGNAEAFLTDPELIQLETTP